MTNIRKSFFFFQIFNLQNFLSTTDIYIKHAETRKEPKREEFLQPLDSSDPPRSYCLWCDSVLHSNSGYEHKGSNHILRCDYIQLT